MESDGKIGARFSGAKHARRGTPFLSCYPDLVNRVIFRNENGIARPNSGFRAQKLECQFPEHISQLAVVGICRALGNWNIVLGYTSDQSYGRLDVPFGRRRGELDDPNSEQYCQSRFS